VPTGKRRKGVMKIRHLFWTSIVVGVVFTVLLVASPLSFAGTPPPGSHFSGPAVRGTFVFSENIDGDLTFDFNGTCGSGDVIAEQMTIPGVSLADVTEEGLLNNVIDGVYFGNAVFDCEPNTAATPDGLLVIKIQSFVEVGNIITADVIMLWNIP
jgi:hypothetical protein